MFPSVVCPQTVQEMVMLSTSLLSIKWKLRGKPKSPLAIVGGDLIIKIHSKFTLNQISGQVIEHEELWDLSESSILAQAYFWASRRTFAATETGKDIADFFKDLPKKFTAESKNVEMYPDPTGDPTKVIITHNVFVFMVIPLFLFFVFAHCYLNTAPHPLPFLFFMCSFSRGMTASKEMLISLHSLLHFSTFLYSS